MSYTRSLLSTLQKRLLEPRRFIQILAGPRQVGKTTLAEQAAANFSGPVHFASADVASLPLPIWIEQQWNAARTLLKQAHTTNACLFLDEVQKIENWSTTVKHLWDEDSKTKLPLQVVLLGSSPLLVQQGLNESLMGRFEVLPVTHWQYSEVQQAFGLTLLEYIYFGGYPSAAALIREEPRWVRYILESLVEVSIAHDILFLFRSSKGPGSFSKSNAGRNLSDKRLVYGKGNKTICPDCFIEIFLLYLMDGTDSSLLPSHAWQMRWKK